jgi:hypothetical protein
MIEKMTKSPAHLTGNMTNELFTLASCQRIILKGNPGFILNEGPFLLTPKTLVIKDAI